MHTGYVISLARRRERLEDFLSHINALGLATSIRFEPVAGVDGSQLNIDEGELRSRIRPWNLQNLNEGRLKGNLGCTLSHLEIWEQIATTSDEMGFVFEDDARLVAPQLASLVAQAVDRIPKDADLVFLNDYDIDRRCGTRFRVRRRGRSLLTPLIGAKAAERVWRPRRVEFVPTSSALLTTTEAYGIAPAFARKLHGDLRNDLGAIDRHVMEYVARHSARVYQVDPPLFTQRDRYDSDTLVVTIVVGYV